MQLTKLRADAKALFGKMYKQVVFDKDVAVCYWERPPTCLTLRRTTTTMKWRRRAVGLVMRLSTCLVRLTMPVQIVSASSRRDLQEKRH